MRRTLITLEAGAAVLTAGLILPTSAQAGLYAPAGVAVDAAGNLLIADSRDRRIREVTG
jgi:hypothetical protein